MTFVLILRSSIHFELTLYMNLDPSFFFCKWISCSTSTIFWKQKYKSHASFTAIRLNKGLQYMDSWRDDIIHPGLEVFMHM